MIGKYDEGGSLIVGSVDGSTTGEAVDAVARHEDVGTEKRVTRRRDDTGNMFESW